MAVAFDRKLGEGNSTSQLSISTDGSLADGEFVVIWAACDNTAGTNLPTVSSILYGNSGTGQTFTVVASHGSSSTSASAATRGFIIVIPSFSTSGASPGTNLTVSFSASPAKCVGLAAVFTGVDNTVAGGPDSVTSPGTATGFSGTAVGNLFLALTSCENNSAMTKDSDTTGGSWVEPGSDGVVFSTGGGAAANVSVIGAYKILTATGTQLWNATGHANDGGACSVELEATASGTNLAVADGAHSHSAETPTLTQVHNATVADARSTHAADNVTVVQNSNLVINDASHGHTADQVAVTVVTNLVVADSSHGHTADNVVLTQAHSVAVADSSHAHAADNVVVTQAHNVAVADSLHAHAAEACNVTEGTLTLAIADATHGHTTDGVALTQVHSVVVADALHGHAVDQVALVQNSNLVVADSAHSHTADEVAVVQEDNNFDLVISDATHAHTTDAVVLVQNSNLVIHDTQHFQEAENVVLRQREIVYLVSTPVREPYEWGPTGLLKFYQQTEGVTWWKVGSDWFSGNYREDIVAEGATEVYRGGYEYEVTGAKATELEALGFTIRTEEQDV
jgi:hypothetical protein